MVTAHIPVHHELHADGCALPRFEDHRTDGRRRRSTALLDFDVRCFFESQIPGTGIGNQELCGHRRSELNVAVIHRLTVEGETWN